MIIFAVVAYIAVAFGLYEATDSPRVTKAVRAGVAATWPFYALFSFGYWIGEE